MPNKAHSEKIIKGGVKNDILLPKVLNTSQGETARIQGDNQAHKEKIIKGGVKNDILLPKVLNTSRGDCRNSSCLSKSIGKK